MKVSQALERRKSIRGFTDQPVSTALIRSVLERAARSPSGGNLQPWRIYVLNGDAHERFRGIMRERLAQNGSADEPAEYPIYPSKLKPPYRDSRYKVGVDMYGLLEIPKEDPEGRMRWFARNYEFFGAPASLFCYVDKQMGLPQWSDLGMFLQSVMLLFQEEGVDTCAQECWSVYHQSVRDFLKPDDEWMLFSGMSIGYRDETERVNELQTTRTPVDEFATFME